MRKLKSGDPVGLQKLREACHEVVDFRNVREDVVGYHQVRLLTLGGQFLRQGNPEEVLYDRNSLRARGCGGAGCGLHTGAGNAARLKILQQVSVVGGDLDDMAFRVQGESRHHLADVPLAMRQPGVREAAEVGVFGTEQLVSPGEILGLGEPAIAAN